VLAFAHIEKTAGITINRILRRSFGVRHCDVEPWRGAWEADFFSASDYRRLQRLYPRLESIAGHTVKPYSDLDQACSNIQYYTFLREPLLRCASHYQYQIQVMRRNIPFEDWIETEKFRNFQTTKIAGIAELHIGIRVLQRFMFVGLVERFDESLVIFQRRAGDPCLSISYRRENVAPSNIIKNQLLSNPKTRAQLVEANRIDLAVYEFVSRDLYRREKRQYGNTLDADVAAFKRTNSPPAFSLKLMLNVFRRNALYKPALFYYRGFQT